MGLAKTIDWWRRLRRYNRARNRALDVDVLWPQILRNARGLAEAKNMFLVHAQSDPAWYKEMSNKEIADFVDVMESPRMQKWKR